MSFAQFAPLALLGPLGGVLADRFDRVRLLAADQAFMMLVALGLTAAELASVAGPGVLLAASLGLGLGFAVAAPSWQATIPRLVAPEMLTSAIALNSTKMSLARIAGPAAGGLLLAQVGAAGVFAVNALSYSAVLTALWALAKLVEAAPSRGGREGVHRQLAEGVRYAAHDPVIRWLLIGVLAVSFVATPLIALLPAYAHDVLGGDASTLGLLTAALGAGALVGSLLLAQLGDRVATPALVGGSIVALAGLTAAVGFAPGLALTAAAVLGTGLCRLGTVAASNTRLQARADDGYRGRVMGLFMLGFGAAYPVGALLVGTLADLWGVQAVTLGMGALTGVAGVTVWRRLAAHAPAPAAEPARAPAGAG